jgi:RNA polymerase sigma factor (sigma-70 family)
MQKYFKRIPSTSVVYNDVVQCGLLGLLCAYRRFKPELGIAFSTYAVAMISGEIRKFLRDYSWNKRNKVVEGRSIVSMNQPLCEGTDDTLETLIAYSGSMSMEDRVNDMADIEDFMAFLYKQPESVQRVFCMRFGLPVTEPIDVMAQEQIAAELGVSQVQVSRIISGTLKKYRSKLCEYDPDYCCNLAKSNMKNPVKN